MPEEAGILDRYRNTFTPTWIPPPFTPDMVRGGDDRALESRGANDTASCPFLRKPGPRRSPRSSLLVIPGLVPGTHFSTCSVPC